MILLSYAAPDKCTLHTHQWHTEKSLTAVHLSCGSMLSNLFWRLDTILPSDYDWTAIVTPRWPPTPHIASSIASVVWVDTLGLGFFVSSVWVKLQSSATWVRFKCQQFTSSQREGEVNVKNWFKLIAIYVLLLIT